ncbi:MAG: D-aminoacyl-tRNA deacylase [Bacteroidales bacterium]|jgi:D-tyrosyl-tRNA(Tyr) deacylase|nr:D-aminoacyl-tRNA deacylase [Bacteroidales bacterium]
MRIVIQRVKRATVSIEQKVYSKIEQGMLVLLGIEDTDESSDAEWLIGKIIKLRIFNDEQGVMNLSINQIEGEILLISQFTLHASIKKGARPSYIRAAKPEKAIPLYEIFTKELNKLLSTEVKTGEFGAEMQVELINDGPVTIIIDSKNRE